MPIPGELRAQGIEWQPAACPTGPVYAWVTNVVSGEKAPEHPGSYQVFELDTTTDIR